MKAKTLADMVGVDASLVTLWRNSDRFPTPENIEKLADVFGVPFYEFFRLDADPSPGSTPFDTLVQARELIDMALKSEAQKNKKPEKKKS